jgi:hypothetical protein
VGYHDSFPLTVDSTDRLSGQHRWYPTSREKRARYPNFLYATPETPTCAAFIEESRMKFINANKLHRKSGGVGHPSFCEGIR